MLKAVEALEHPESDIGAPVLVLGCLHYDVPDVNSADDELLLPALSLQKLQKANRRVLHRINQ